MPRSHADPPNAKIRAHAIGATIGFAPHRDRVGRPSPARQRDHRRRTRHRRTGPQTTSNPCPVDLAVHGELHACFHLSQRRQAARDDAVFNELIARLDEEDDDSDG